MRVVGLAAAGMLALTTPMTAHAAPLGSNIKQVAPPPGIAKVWERLRLGLASGTLWALEPMEGRMGSPTLRAESVSWRVGSLLELGRSLQILGRSLRPLP